MNQVLRKVVRVTLPPQSTHAKIEDQEGNVMHIAATSPLIGRMRGEEVRYYLADVTTGALDLLEDAKAWA